MDTKFVENQMDEIEQKKKPLLKIYIMAFVFGISVIVAIIFFVVFTHRYLSDLLISQSCYQYPSCVNTLTSSSGFTNNTGWSNFYSDQCCQICPSGTQINCFNQSSLSCEILKKTKNGSEDYDYLLFDQIWINQLCNAFENKYDPTLSHLSSSSCDQLSHLSSNLTIHGLWPNYFSGFPACCDSLTPLSPLDPSQVQTWSIWQDLQQFWIDPSTSLQCEGVACSSCYLLNHEWQKHGGCFSPDPLTYFSAGLDFYRVLSNISSAVSAMSGEVAASNLSSLYPSKANLICDPNDPSSSPTVGVFLEVQTCWEKVRFNASDTRLVSTGGGYFRSMDCPPASATHLTTPCPSLIRLREFN